VRAWAGAYTAFAGGCPHMREHPPESRHTV